MTVGFLYGPGAETLTFVTGTSGKYLKIFVSRQKNQSQLWIPGKPRKIGVWVSGAEIQTSAVDTRTAVWVSTAAEFSKIFLGETRNFSQKFRGVSAPALYKNPAVTRSCRTISAKLTIATVAPTPHPNCCESLPPLWKPLICKDPFKIFGQTRGPPQQEYEAVLHGLTFTGWHFLR